MNQPMYDAIIIGSGAGGSAAAYRLATTGRQVLLIEKGEALPTDGSTLDIEQVVRLGKFKSRETWSDGAGGAVTPEEYFNLGGKTKWYGAAIVRFSPEEFGGDPARGFLPWPIQYSDLEPYYLQAEHILGQRTFPCEPDLERILKRLQRSGGWEWQPLATGLDPNILDYPEEARHFDGFASVRRLKSDAESSFLSKVIKLPNIRLLTGCAVRELLADPADPLRVTGVALSDGREFRAANVLLAAGALHSPRLLQRYIEHLGLESRLAIYHNVGRNLKLHLLTALLAISPGRKRDVLRKTALLVNPRFPRSTVQPLGFDGELISMLFPRPVPRPVARFFGARAYGFFLQTEDESDRRNRVVAGNAAGSEPPVLDYTVERQKSAWPEHRALIAGLKRDLARAGYVSFAQRIGVAGTAHACGTLAAGRDPRRSVVNAQGRVHGMQGLYVVDGSVLPRSSRVNPSLTIYAWALRVADGLVQSLRAAA